MLDMKLIEVDEINLQKEFEELAKEGCEKMQARIRKRTRKTAENLTYEASEKGYTIYGKKPYYRVLHLLEKGTKHSSPYPFMAPVARELAKRNEEIILKALDKAVKIE